MTLKTLTLRLPQDNLFHEAFNFCSDFLNQKTASKTFIESMYSLQSFVQMHQDQLKQIELLTSENQKLKQVIKDARMSSIAFTEALSQDDLFK